LPEAALGSAPTGAPPLRISRGDQSAIHYRWDASLPPRITVDPGTEVVIETRPGDDGQALLNSTSDDPKPFDYGRLHALAGPIAVRGAEPGDSLVVHILELVPGDVGFTMMRRDAGLLTDFEPWTRTYRLDREHGTAEVADGVRVPLRPFFGVMGTAPLGESRSTIPPDTHGGNIDCRDIEAGTTLRLPVFVPGALFSCGDGHAAQGDGEVCVTAIECEMTGRLRFELEKQTGLAAPQLETDDAWMTFGAAPTVEEAARQAVRAMLDVIRARTVVDEPTAYAIASQCVDVRINQLVNRPNMGVRAVLPKSVFTVAPA
jgi:acetamidase/formamidase